MARKTDAASTTRRGALALAPLLAALALVSCSGGGTGNDRDSGTSKTTLTVQASDADGDTLHYSWRVTAGTVDNVDKASTVWTLPAGPGLHFAYVSISDGKGGYIEQQYAVSSDTIDNPVAARAAAAYTPPAVTDFDGALTRLRFVAPQTTVFAAAGGGGSGGERYVYMADVRVQVVRQGSSDVVYTGVSDQSGEVNLPKLPAGGVYDVRCATSDSAAPVVCNSITIGTEGATVTVAPALTTSSNLRLFGHVALSDGAICGAQNNFFNVDSSATVELLAADGSNLTQPVRVNRWGDYTLDAGVPVRGALKARIRCENYSRTLDVPAAPAAGYAAATPVELSHAITNVRPQVVKMVANGPEGNVRGQMVVPLANATSDAIPGPLQFLTYKGRDSAISSCLYYRALGAVRGCNADGSVIDPFTLDDWKRAHKLGPYTAGNTEYTAMYINKMDLNLGRRMTATRASANDIAFYVCNNPGPLTSQQAEIDQVIDSGLRAEKQVACVAMEWSVTPGVNGGRPFTKFYVFGPDGVLRPSVNLDGRGEKFVPGACVACHGGGDYYGGFPVKGNPSPYLGSAFLGFDTQNYFFGSASDVSEAAQSEAFYQLNALVAATEPSGAAPINRTFAGWYPNGTHVQNKAYVPAAWQAADAATPGAARLYQEVIGQSCRTCHAAMGKNFDWDTIVLTPTRASNHFCGGTPDVGINASMPNALITRDRVGEKVRADASLGALLTTFLGCSTPLPDPVYPRR